MGTLQRGEKIAQVEVDEEDLKRERNSFVSSDLPSYTDKAPGSGDRPGQQERGQVAR